jgi:hypothetical protein
LILCSQIEAYSLQKTDGKIEGVKAALEVRCDDAYHHEQLRESEAIVVVQGVEQGRKLNEEVKTNKNAKKGRCIQWKAC